MTFAPPRRGLVSALFVALALLGISIAQMFRSLEAQVARHLFVLVGLGPTLSSGDSNRFFAQGPGGTWTRFTITTQCSVMLLFVPIFLTAAILVLARSVRVRSTAIGVLRAIVILVVANQVRLALIGWCIRFVGFRFGYPLGHLLLGALLSIVAVAWSVRRLVGESRSSRAVTS